MTLLSIEGEMLVLAAPPELLTSPINKSFLTRDLGFSFNEDRCIYSFKGKITPDIVETIVEFLKMCGIPHDIDQKCAALIKQNETQRSEFDSTKEKGALIKTKKYRELDIPFMETAKKLKPYQIMPVVHASSLDAAANFSVPGSGKTWMAYATYFLFKDRAEVDKLMVIGPLSSFRPWETEYTEMTGKKPNSVRISGIPSKRKMILNYPDRYEIFLISYQTAQIEISLLKEMLNQFRFMVIVDEAHHIKNPTGEWANAILELARYAKKRMILTGTPIPNKLNDIWTQFTFLYPDGSILGDYITFQYEIAKQDAFTTLSHRLNPFYTRISKSTLKLPQPKFVRMTISMSQIQRRIYDAIRGFIRTNDPLYRNDAFALRQFRTNSMIYLLEASTDPSLLTKSSQFTDRTIKAEGLSIQELIDRYEQYEIPRKLTAVQELVKQSLAKDEKIIIWCSFIPTIEKLSEMLKSFKPVKIWGAIPKDDEEDPEFNREKEIEKFKSTSSHNLLIANPASLAESVSLHKICHHAIYLDRTFNGGHYMQSLERIHRIGIDPKVTTRYTILLSSNSIDHVIDSRLEEKKDKMLRFLNEQDFVKLNLDLDYANAFGEDDEFMEDYRRVYDHIMKG